MPAPCLTTLAWVAIAIAFGSAAVVLADIFPRRYRLKMPIMEAVWPVTARISGRRRSGPVGTSAAPVATPGSSTTTWISRGDKPGWATIATGVSSILVVEDDDDMRAYLARLLTEDGWQVHAVADADQALAVTVVPDLVLSDVMLPGRSGLELVRAVRATAAMGDVPVLLLTARAGSDATAQGLAAGADDYLTKPFQARELLARVQVHYELSKLRGFALRQANNQVANLQVALASNRRIGAAMGVLMARHTITEDQSFALLRDASQQSNRKLRDVADAVIHTGELP